MTESQSARRFNPAHAIIVVYTAPALAALVVFGVPLVQPTAALVALSARYASLLFATLPLLVAASLWTTLTNLIPVPSGSTTAQEDGSRRPAFSTLLRSAVQPLPIDERQGGSVVRHPATLAASGAWHPVTVTAVALTFGVTSGFTLFFVTLAVVIVIVAALVARCAVPRSAAVSVSHNTDAPAISAPGRCNAILSTELYHRLRLAVLGLLVAVALHILIPQPVVRFFTANPAASVAAMVVLALLLSLPPEAAPAAAALFLGATSHGAVLAFTLISAVSPARALPAWFRRTGVARTPSIRAAIAFTVTAVLLIAILTLPISDRAAGALW